MVAIASSSLLGYDLVSSIGPIGGLTSDPNQWKQVPTSLGLITLEGFNSPYAATFTATVGTVPEPSTMILLGSGLVGLVGFRRKFKK